MNSLQATDDKHLILEDQFEGEANALRPPLHSEYQHGFCGKRYLCFRGIHDQEFWRFDIFDLLTNESKSVRFSKSCDQYQNVRTRFLNYKFMLIVESADQLHNVGLHRVTLVKLNWEFGVFETLEHIERRANAILIFTDPLNQSKFVLTTLALPDPEYQYCKLVNGKIEFGNVYQSRGGYYLCSNSKLMAIDNLGRKFRVKTYNMADKQEKSFETEEYPDRTELTRNSPHRWVIDRLYVAIRFQDSGNYGLMWADQKTRRWNILDFSTIMEIQALNFFNGSLIVQTEQRRTENGIFKSSVKVYGIDIHRPQSLRQKAWIRVIRKLKAERNLDPYKEATRYLPFNSDLRPYWFEDVEEESTEKQDSEKSKNSNSDGPIDDSEAVQKAKLDQGKNSEKSDGDKEVPSKRLKPI